MFIVAVQNMNLNG